MNNKNELRLLEFRMTRRHAFNTRRRATSLVALAGVLVLAMLFSSAGFAAGSSTDPDLERSLEASTLRWVRLGEAYEAARAEAAAMATTNRYKAMAAFYDRGASASVAARNADSDRWVRLGEALEAARAEASATSMTNRYKALAAFHDRGATESVGRDADSDRWVKLGQVYAAARAEAAATAMTNRYKALAEYCGSAPAQPQAVLCSADLTAFTR